MTEEQEIEEYRAQVRSYLETGKSDTLSDSEKAELNKARVVPKKGLWENIKSYL